MNPNNPGHAIFDSNNPKKGSCYFKGATIKNTDKIIVPRGEIHTVHNTNDSSKCITLMYVVDSNNTDTIGYIRTKYIEKIQNSEGKSVYKLNSKRDNVRLRLMARFEDPSLEKNDLINDQAYRGLIVDKSSVLWSPSDINDSTLPLTRIVKLVQLKDDLDKVGYVFNDDYNKLIQNK